MKSLLKAVFLLLCLASPGAYAGPPLDLCDPVTLTPALLKTLTPAEMKCVWRSLKKMAPKVRTYEGFLIEVNDYGANFDARVSYQQSGSAEGKRSGKLKPVAVSDYRVTKKELERWNDQMAGFKPIKNDRILIPSVIVFEGRSLIRCDHLFGGVVRYSEWLDSQTGLVLRAAGFDEKERFFFARIYSCIRIGQTLGPEPNFDRKRTKALAKLLSRRRLDSVETVEEFVESMKLKKLQS